MSRRLHAARHRAALHDSIVGAWLLVRRRAVDHRTRLRRCTAAVGRSDAPIDMLWTNNRPPPGIVTHRDRFPRRRPGDRRHGRRHARAHRIRHRRYLDATSPWRTSIALSSHRTQGRTRCAAHRLGTRERSTSDGCATAVDLMDGGAQSLEGDVAAAAVDRRRLSAPGHADSASTTTSATRSRTSTWAGRTVEIAVEYDGEQHGTDRDQWRWDVRAAAHACDDARLVARQGDRRRRPATCSRGSPARGPRVDTAATAAETSP